MSTLVIPPSNFGLIVAPDVKVSHQKPFFEFLDVNIAFLRGLTTTKIEPCFTPYTLKSQMHQSKISLNITKHSLFVVLGLLDF